MLLRIRLGTALVALWALSLLLACAAYLAWLQPSRIAGTLETLLETNVAVPCDVGSFSIDLFPRPTLHAENLSLRKGSLEHVSMTVRHVSAAFSWVSILRLSPIVRKVRLEEPVIKITCGGHAVSVQENRGPAAPGKSFFKLHSSLIGTNVRIEHGSVFLSRESDGQHCTLDDINVTSRLPGLFHGNIQADIGSIAFESPDGIHVTGEAAQVHIDELRHADAHGWQGHLRCSARLQMDSLEKYLGHAISRPYQYFPMPEPLSLNGDAGFHLASSLLPEIVSGTVSAEAVLPMNGHDTPLSVALPLSYRRGSGGIGIEGARIAFDGDLAELNGFIDLDTPSPCFRGNALIRQFSLTRWFGFGRRMDAGLQKTLDRISGSFEDMTLDRRGITVPRLHARLYDMDFQGSGSCRDFLKPFIAIDIHAAHADLDKVFTELHGIVPDMSYLPPPAVPFSEKNASQNGEGIGFDIHISADEAGIINLRPRSIDVHVVPSPKGTKLQIGIANLYGGDARASVDLRDRVQITADLKGVDMRRASAALTGFEPISGTLQQGHFDIGFDHGSGIRMLHTLSVNARAVIGKGMLKNRKKALTPFNSLTLSVNAQTPAKTAVPAALPPGIPYYGAWDITLDTKGYACRVRSDAALLNFSTAYWLPSSMANQKCDVQLTLKNAAYPQLNGQKFSLKGRGSFNIDKSVVKFSDATLSHALFTATGSAELKNWSSGFSLSGHAEASALDFRKTIELLGIRVPLSIAGSESLKMRLNGAFSISPQQFRLENLQGSLDRYPFRGHLSGAMGKIPSYQASLVFDDLDLDAFLPRPSLNQWRPTGNKTPLPLDMLRASAAAVQLHAGKLRLLSTTLTDADMNIDLKGGRLSAPFHAAFHGGGRLRGMLSAVAAGDKHADISLNYASSDVDMLSLSRDRAHNTLISGKGSSSAELTARQVCWDDWKNTLNGKMSFSIVSGRIFSAPSESRQQNDTPFKTMSMSATARNGIISSNDFLLKGSMSTIKGSGEISLANLAINARAVVTLIGIPELPFTITGTLNEPKINYKVFGAVTGTVGNIGSTVFDIIGGIITAPIRLLTGNRFLGNDQ